MTAPQTPTPGVPLSAESDPRMTDAEANPLHAVQYAIESWQEYGDANDAMTFLDMWQQGDLPESAQYRDWCRSLTTPSDQVEAFEPSPERYYPHHPASGSDGLETVGWRWKSGCGYFVANLGIPRPFTAEPLVTREAAEKRIAYEREQHAIWQGRALSAENQSELLESQVAALKAALERAREDILGLLRGRDCEAEGSEEDWIGHIDQALALKEGR